MPVEPIPNLAAKLEGVLLGTAIGDALGLPMEGMSASAIARSFPRIERFQLWGKTGFVSDDTEQSALVARSLARHPSELADCLRSFRFSLLGWFLRLPWGIGLGTLKACFRIALGFRRSGVRSAGNGAAMRSAIIGAFFFDRPAERALWSEALARVTHEDERAVAGARFVAELTALCIAEDPGSPALPMVERALQSITQPDVCEAIRRAMRLAAKETTRREAAVELGNTGFIVHTIAIACFCFLRFQGQQAVVETIRAGGDTDSNAAIVGAWVGALEGPSVFPAPLTARIHDRDWPARHAFGGPSHLRALARDLVRARRGEPPIEADFSAASALLRNLALYPVVLFHAFRVLTRG